MRFLLNKRIIFDDQECAVRDLKTSQITKLGGTNGRCLSCLLLQYRQQSIVTKKDLFYAGWERYGLNVGDNNLAQAIFQLRKLFRLLFNQDVIVTVPRIGFTLKNLTVDTLNEVSLSPDLVDTQLISGSKSEKLHRLKQRLLALQPPNSFSVVNTLATIAKVLISGLALLYFIQIQFRTARSHPSVLILSASQFPSQVELSWLYVELAIRCIPELNCLTNFPFSKSSDLARELICNSMLTKQLFYSAFSSVPTFFE